MLDVKGNITCCWVSSLDVLPLKNFLVDIRFNAHRLLHNKRAIYERVTISLLHMLRSLEEDNDDLIQLLNNVLSGGAPLLGPLDGVANQSCPEKVSGLDHSKAFKDAWKGLVKSMVAIESADREWIVVSRSSPGSILGLDRLSLDI